MEDEHDNYNNASIATHPTHCVVWVSLGYTILPIIGLKAAQYSSLGLGAEPRAGEYS